MAIAAFIDTGVLLAGVVAGAVTVFVLRFLRFLWLVVVVAVFVFVVLVAGGVVVVAVVGLHAALSFATSLLSLSLKIFLVSLP